MVIIAIIFAIYLFIMLWIGIKFYEKNENLSDYLLGGRQLNSWVTAMSAQASDMSGWLLIGLPGLAYMLYAGTSEAMWTAIGLWLGTYLNWLFVAQRLRKFTHVAGDSITLPDFFEKRFEDDKHILRMISAVFIVIFFVVYTSSQYAAGGKLFNTIFGIHYVWGLLIGAAIVLGYTALGGFNAVCVTDTVMGILMFFALMIVPIVAVVAMGGKEELAIRLAELTPEKLGFFPRQNGAVDHLLMASALGWGLGYFGQPHILARFMAIESPDHIKKSRIIAMIWVTVTLAAAVCIGVIGKALLPNLADGETVYMDMIKDLFNPVVAGILMTAILAAIMSTASSQLLVAASSVSKDLYATIAKKSDDDPQIVWLSRVTVVGVSVVAIIIGINPDSSVFRLVSMAWGGFGAAFGPLILFSLFWKRMTKAGAVAGLLTGGIVDIIWHLMDGGIFDVYEIIPGFICASIVIVVVSLMGKPCETMVEEFERVGRAKFTRGGWSD